MTNRWEIADTTDISYSSFYSQSGGNLSGIDENDFVVMGGTHDFNWQNNRYLIKRFTEKASKNEIIYYDTTNVNFRFLSISHPSKNFIVVVGDSNEYLGHYGKYENYKTFGMIMRTTDRGGTWEKRIIDSNNSFMSVSMCDSLNGIILQSDKDNYYNPKEVFNDSLLITNYGWITAYKIPVPSDAGRVVNCWCLSPQKFYLQCRSLSDGTEFIYNTTDGGTTWNQSAHFDKGINIYDIKFLNDKKIFVAVNRWVGDFRSAYEPGIYKSVDGGETWLECKNIFREREEDVFRLYSIDFFDDLNGIAVGAEGKILRTNDGGDTWTKEYLPFELPKPSIYNTIITVFYPKNDFAFILMSNDFALNCYNYKILSKPTFYSIYNPGYLPLNDVKLSWTSIKGAGRYRLKVDTIRVGGNTGQYDFEHPLIDTILTDTTFIIKNLEYNTIYHSWVKAINDSMESDWSDENSGFSTISFEDDLYSPNLIYPAYASRVENNKVTLRWNNVPTAERYLILINNDENSDVTSELLTDTTITITDLVPSAFYYVILKSQRGINTSYERWSYFRTRAVLGVEDELISEENDRLNIYPNPFSNKITIAVEGNNKTEAIILFDIFGRTIQTLKTKFLESGKTFDLELATEGLPSGVYFVRLQGSHIAKVVIKAE
ncbi:MAG: hypothetical protein A2X61_17080 [Ignavibacteria bacterium GWB2_35_12]|nr:MAG: hypothetical protein A2X61_17080 [Ignavibacteria bacterium GWB2_35_12]